MKFTFFIHSFILFIIFSISKPLYSQTATLSMIDTIVDAGAQFDYNLHLEFQNTTVSAIQFGVVFDSDVLQATGCSAVGDIALCNPISADTILFAMFVTVGSYPSGFDISTINFNTIGNPSEQTTIEIIDLLMFDVNSLQISPTNINVDNGLVKINCLDNILILSGDDYDNGDVIKIEANNSIIAFNKILTGADVTYDAGQMVQLNIGFEVQLGAEFNAKIDGCFGL